MSSKKDVSVDMEVLKALVDDGTHGGRVVKRVGVEERVGGEAWHGSVAVITTPSSKKNRGSAFKQVCAAFFGNLGTVNTGMMFGFSAVTIPQLKADDSAIKINDDEASWIASLSSVATPIGCIVSGYLLDAIGRKRTLILTLIPMMLGWFLISAATSVYYIYVGRLLIGLGSGMVGSPARVYTAEITQPHLRGMLAAVASVGVSLGVTIEYVVGSVLPWPILALISGVIPTIAFISSFFLPESPTWLLSRGLTEQGRQSLKKLRGDGCDVDAELQELIDFTKRTNSNQKPSAKETFRAVIHPSAIKPFAILSLYFLVYQFSGVNPVTFYAVEIFQDSGTSMNKYVATVLLGLIRLGFTIVSCIMMRRCGRRPLTFISSVLCGLSMLSLGTYMYQGIQWKAEGVPAPATWFPVAAIFLFIAASTIGYLVVPWVMIGELYPSKVRGIMGGMTTFCGHFCVFVVVKTFPFLRSTISQYGTFWLYGTVSLLGTIYFYYILPETKGRTLQEIEDYFSGRTKTLKPDKNKSVNNNNRPTIVKSNKNGEPMA